MVSANAIVISLQLLTVLLVQSVKAHYLQIVKDIWDFAQTFLMV